uniref:RPGR1_C domain-containing protein n=1 Tax=Macrostomum lignano TaxID=282301 RepID=A0A1I8I0K6_9PLAT
RSHGHKADIACRTSSAPSSADLSTPNWSSMAKVRGSTRLSRPLLKSNAATRPSTGGVTPPSGAEVTPPSGAEVTPPSGAEVTPPSGVEVPSDASVLHTNLCLLWHLSLRSRPADSVTQFTVQSALSGEAGVQLDEAEPHRVEQLCRLAAVDSEAELVHKVQLRLGEHRRQLRRVSLAVEVGLVEVGLKLRHHVALLVVQPPAAGTSALRPPPPVDETAGVGAQLAHKRVPLVIQRVEPPLTVTSDQRLVNAVQLREVVSVEAPYSAYAVRPPVACRVGPDGRGRCRTNRSRRLCSETVGLPVGSLAHFGWTRAVSGTLSRGGAGEQQSCSGCGEAGSE